MYPGQRYPSGRFGEDGKLHAAQGFYMTSHPQCTADSATNQPAWSGGGTALCSQLNGCAVSALGDNRCGCFLDSGSFSNNCYPKDIELIEHNSPAPNEFPESKWCYIEGACRQDTHSSGDSYVIFIPGHDVPSWVDISWGPSFPSTEIVAPGQPLHGAKKLQHSGQHWDDIHCADSSCGTCNFDQRLQEWVTYGSCQATCLLARDRFTPDTTPPDTTTRSVSDGLPTASCFSAPGFCWLNNVCTPHNTLMGTMEPTTTAALGGDGAGDCSRCVATPEEARSASTNDVAWTNEPLGTVCNDNSAGTHSDTCDAVGNCRGQEYACTSNDSESCRKGNVPAEDVPNCDACATPTGGAGFSSAGECLINADWCKIEGRCYLRDDQHPPPHGGWSGAHVVDGRPSPGGGGWAGVHSVCQHTTRCTPTSSGTCLSRTTHPWPSPWDCIDGAQPRPYPGVTIPISWTYDSSVSALPPMTAFVGDTVEFTWTNLADTGTAIHNVWLHPSGGCDESDAAMVPAVVDSYEFAPSEGIPRHTASYTFESLGTYTFASDVGTQCEAGGMRVMFSVSEKNVQTCCLDKEWWDVSPTDGFNCDDLLLNTYDDACGRHGGHGTFPFPQTDIGSTCLGQYYDGQFGSAATCDLTTRHAHWNITTLEGRNTYTVDVSYSGNGRNHDNATIDVGSTTVHLPDDRCQTYVQFLSDQFSWFHQN